MWLCSVCAVWKIFKVIITDMNIFPIAHMFTVMCQTKVISKVIWKTCTSSMGARRNIPAGVTSTLCLSFSDCWRCNANARQHNVLRFLHRLETAPCYGKSRKNMRFVGSNIFFLSYFFPHHIKKRGLPLSAVTVLLHYLPKFFAFNRRMRQNDCYATWSESWKICCYVIFPQ